MTDDLEFDEIYSALSHPDDGPTAVSRRRFLQGALAGGSALTLLNGPLARMAMAAAPVGPSDGILVVIMLGGGNDGLNTVIPVGDAAYRSMRSTIAVPDADVLPLGAGAGLGLHPSLVGLKARYDAGKVAVVRGVGKPDGDHSHFTSMATWMAGTAGTDRRTGWLGRWLDTLPDGDDGLRGVSIGTSVPLHMVGTRAQVTAMPDRDGAWGADLSEPWEQRMVQAVARFGATTTGRGSLADMVGRVDAAAVRTAEVITPLYAGDPPAGELTPQLDLAARLVNLDVGVRVVTATLGSFDHHDDQADVHARLLADLDAAIARFYAVLAPRFADQVTLMTFSEFGRRAEQNASRGTDHGTSSVMFVVGDHVKGGLYGTQPSLGDLDSRGDLRVHVDFRSVYASVLGGWMGADAPALLGGTYPDLGLFRLPPGTAEPPPPPPPPPDPRWRPFPTAARLVEQQYLDFLNRPADAKGRDYWVARLVGGLAPAACIQSFLDSREFGGAVAPAARIALCGRHTPGFEDLMAWAAIVRAGGDRRPIADAVVATPGWAARYGGLSSSALVDRLHRDALGVAPTATWAGTWAYALATGAKVPADLLLAVAGTDAYARRAKPLVDVTTIYAGMLRRAPDAGGFSFWVDQATRGRSLAGLISGFLTSAEYARRFA